MTTPPGEDPGGTPPSDPSWSWEPKTFGDPAPSPIPRSPDDVPAEPVEPPPPEVIPPASVGLAWDSERAPGEPPVAQVPETVWTPPPPPSQQEIGVSPPKERYPMDFDVAYPEGLSRWKTLLRLFLLLPASAALYFVMSLMGAGLQVGWMTVFWRRKYPDWLFRGVQGALGFSARFYAYALLVTDKFPSFSPDDSPVSLEFDQPPSGDLSRWRVVLWKTVLLVPHFLALYLLNVVLFVTTTIAWFGILLTGNYPRGLFQFSVGIQRWYLRVIGYLASFNDRFPPFSFGSEAGPAGSATTVISGIGGGILTAGFVAAVVAAALTAGPKYTEDVDYAQLVAGRDQQSHLFDVDFSDDQVLLRLSRAVDPGDSLIQVIRPASTQRIVVFQWTVVNGSNQSQEVAWNAAQLKYRYEDEDGDDKEKTLRAEIIGVNNVTAPARISAGGTATVQAVFVIPENAEPLSLWFKGGFAGDGVRYNFGD